MSSHSSRIPLLIDTDPGVDDALALLMAFASPGHEVIGLTIAAGNVGLSYTVANALKLCEVAGVDVPVYPGCPVQLLRPAPDASHVHGLDGFGDVGYLPAGRTAEAEHAALAIIRLSHRHAGRLLLVMLGPLTNLALALRLDPGLPDRLGRVVVMGGAVTGLGNITPWAEFNFAFDPEAAHVVLESLPDIDLVDWEAVLAHSFARADMERWLGADHPHARFYGVISRRFRDWLVRERGDRGHAADSLAMAAALAPEAVVEWAGRPLCIALEGPARGASLVDWQRQSGQPDNARILRSFDQVRFEEMIRRGLGVPE
jgi:purine nucleosidase